MFKKAFVLKIEVQFASSQYPPPLRKYNQVMGAPFFHVRPCTCTSDQSSRLWHSFKSQSIVVSNFCFWSIFIKKKIMALQAIFVRSKNFNLPKWPWVKNHDTLSGIKQYLCEVKTSIFPFKIEIDRTWIMFFSFQWPLTSSGQIHDKKVHQQTL